MRACNSFLSWLKQHDIRVVHVHHRRLAAILNVLKMFGGYQLIYTGNLTYPFEFWFWLLCPRIATGVTQSVIENMRHTSRAKEFHLISNGCDFPAECPPVDVARVRKHRHLHRQTGTGQGSFNTAGCLAHAAGSRT